MQKYYIFAILVLAMALVAGTEACAVNNSRYISDTLPTTMGAGVTYTATVTMQNTGDTAWTDGSGAKQYDFGAWDGASPGANRTWTAPRTLIGGTVAPGATHTFTLIVTAPVANGTYDTKWGMVQEEVQWFGEIVHKTITVTGEIGAVTALKATPQADGSCTVVFTLPADPDSGGGAVGGAVVTINGSHPPVFDKDGPAITVTGIHGQAVSCTFTGYTPGIHYYYSVHPFCNTGGVKFTSWGPASYTEATNLVPAEHYFITDNFNLYNAGGARLDGQGPSHGAQAANWSIRSGSNANQLTVVVGGRGGTNAVRIQCPTADAAVEAESSWDHTFHLSGANPPYQTFNPGGRCKLSFWFEPITGVGGDSSFWAVTFREPEEGFVYGWVEGTDTDVRAFDCKLAGKTGAGSPPQPISKDTWHSLDIIAEIGIPNTVYYYLDGAWFWTGISTGMSNRVKDFNLIAQGADTTVRQILIDDMKIGDAASPVNAIIFPHGAPTGSYTTATPTLAWDRYWWLDRVTGFQVKVCTSPAVDSLGNPTGTMIYDSGEVAGNATGHTMNSALPEAYYNTKLYVFERDKVQYAADDARGGYQPWSAPGEFVVSSK